MEKWERANKSKGGRPPKTVKKDQLLGVKCSIAERRIIAERAATVRLTISEYLRELGLTGRIDHRQIALPPELLELKAQLRHIGANLNQLAKVYNSSHQLDPAQQIFLASASGRVIILAERIEKHFQ